MSLEINPSKFLRKIRSEKQPQNQPNTFIPYDLRVHHKPVKVWELKRGRFVLVRIEL